MTPEPLWLEDEEIAERLATLDPGQVREALAAIALRQEAHVDELSFAPALAPLADALDGDLGPADIETLARLRLGHVGEHVVSRDHALEDLARLALRLRGTSGQYTLAIVLRVDDDAPEAVRQVVSSVGHGVASGEARLDSDVDYFLSNLLDDEDVRGATVAALATWPRSLETEEVLVRLAPELTPAERQAIGLHDDGSGLA